MLKFLFFDERDCEVAQGFERRLEPPRKHRNNPLFLADAPWENGYMSLYGSVARRPDGLFQLWYTSRLPAKDKCLTLNYAESDDGIAWRRPELDVLRWKGRQTNVVFTRHPHGATVILDPADPDERRRYKMLTGASPSGRISAFQSPDGIHWQAFGHNPVIPSNPDCPMSLHRQRDGRYVLYVRAEFADRRVARAESWDFQHWERPRRVLEPGPGDPAQLQFYGMGAVQYGPFEIGTLWMYHTVTTDARWSKMAGYQEAELAYAREGYAWHRAAQGRPFIPHGRRGSWEQGNLQCASSPLLFDGEVRFYYAASRRFHGEPHEDGKAGAGLGLATARPDRFVGLRAQGRGALVSRVFWMASPEVFVNADVARDGRVVVELLDPEWKPLRGFRSLPITGDGVGLPVVWPGRPDLARVVRRPIRFRLTARDAAVYSVWMRDGDAVPDPYRFRARGFIDPAIEMNGPPEWW